MVNGWRIDSLNDSGADNPVITIDELSVSIDVIESPCDTVLGNIQSALRINNDTIIINDWIVATGLIIVRCAAGKEY